MFDPIELYKSFKEHGINFFAGVPDSLLKGFSACLSQVEGSEKHRITANEGGAVALATGYHLATGKPALVYMQNSGLGNAVNPLVSLTSQAVYGIPLVLLIGWRGEPGLKDEPQHRFQGEIQNMLLDTLNIPYWVLDDGIVDLNQFVKRAIDTAINQSSPVAIVVKKGTIGNFKQVSEVQDKRLSREEAIKLILKTVSEDDVLVSTTGKASREVYECRQAAGMNTGNDFLCVGSMGHASMIALGIALNTTKQVFCLDGDGALLMHMGALTDIGLSGATNYTHILLNNGSHDSVGGQPTAGFKTDFPSLAKACAYKRCFSAEAKPDIEKVLSDAKKIDGPVFIEIKIQKGARENLSRPSETPDEQKKKFMAFMKLKKL